MLEPRSMPHANSLYFEPFEFIPSTCELRRGGTPVPLQGRAGKALGLLLANEGRLVTKDALIETLWPDRIVDFDQGLHNVIRELRGSLQDDAKNPRFIETVPRRGYRFLASVSTKSSGSQISPSDGKRKNSKRFTSIGLVLALLCILLLLRPYHAGQTGQASSLDKVRIIVLPFSAESRETDASALAGRMTKALTHELVAASTKDRFEVLGSVTAASRGEMPSSESIAALKLDYVVSGAVLGTGEDLEVGIEVTDATGGVGLWASRYQTELSDLFLLEEEVAQDIVATLGGPGYASRVSPQRRSPEAMEGFLRGRYLLDHPAQGASDPIQALERALSLEPDFVEAHLALAEAHLRGASSAEELESARFGIAEVRRIQPSNTEALLLEARMAHQIDWNWDLAACSLSRAFEISSSDPAVLTELAGFLVTLAQYEEALALIQKALRLDPISPMVRGDAASYFLLTENFQEALDTARSHLELQPDSWFARSIEIEALLRLGHSQQARAVASAAMGVSITSENLKQGIASQSREIWRAQPPSAERSVVLAGAEATLDNADAAVDWLEEAADQGSRFLPFAAIHQDFAQVRDHPRFRDFMARRIRHPSFVADGTASLPCLPRLASALN